METQVPHALIFYIRKSKCVGLGLSNRSRGYGPDGTRPEVPGPGQHSPRDGAIKDSTQIQGQVQAGPKPSALFLLYHGYILSICHILSIEML